MRSNYFVFLLLLLYSFILNASPHHKGLLSSVNLGIRYSSLLQNRGVILYDDFQIDPVLGVFFFDDRVEFLGDSLGFRDFIYKDQLRFRTRLVSITDQPLFPAHESLKANSPHRKETYEWSNQLELFLPGYNENYFAEIDLGLNKDLSAHKGTYIELQTKIKLLEFRPPKVETLIEPNMLLTFGWGDSAHNQYLYGPSANTDEFNNFSYGLWFAFPEEADRNYPIIQIKHFEVIGDSKNAEFAKDRNSGWVISFIATGGIWPL